MTSRLGILVVGESGVGGVRASTREAATAAKGIAASKPQPIVGLLFGTGIEETAQAFGATGIDRVLVADQPDLATPSAEAATTVIARAIETIGPAIVLIANTTLASEYAPRLAARLRVGLVTDCFALRYAAGALIASRSVLGGRLQTDVTLDSEQVMIVSLRAGSFEQAESGDSNAPVEVLSVTLSELDRAARVVSTVEKTTSGVGLDTAEIVVAGGRGLKEAANFQLVEDLATMLGGAVGATRAVTDVGWRPHDEQIGQTGKIVSPQLYVAIGISGAVQHVVGMQGAEYVVAINRDPDAAIFKRSSFGIVGDLFEVVPAVMGELRNAATS